MQPLVTCDYLNNNSLIRQLHVASVYPIEQNRIVLSQKVLLVSAGLKELEVTLSSHSLHVKMDNPCSYSQRLRDLIQSGALVVLQIRKVSHLIVGQYLENVLKTRSPVHSAVICGIVGSSVRCQKAPALSNVYKALSQFPNLVSQKIIKSRNQYFGCLISLVAIRVEDPSWSIMNNWLITSSCLFPSLPIRLLYCLLMVTWFSLPLTDLHLVFVS